MKKEIPLFIKHFSISNIKLLNMLKDKGHKLSPQQISQKLKPTHKTNQFNKYELLLLSEIEQEFLNDYRQKLVTYKVKKFRQNERSTKHYKR